MGALAIGSEAHKELFCRTFIDTFDPYEPARLPWPELDEESRQQLISLPVWDEAVNTESSTAKKVQRAAECEADPLVREAIALQGFEEQRHADLLDFMTARYGIPVQRRADPPLTAHPTWAFMRTGYGECFDSFFAFGLFKIAGDSGFFPPALVAIFEPVMQEEARHIQFFVNWVAYRRAHLPFDQRPLLDLRRGLAVTLQVLDRVKTALSLAGGGSGQDHFTMKSHTSVGDFSLRSFLELCLRENDRRLSVYDAQLLRPTLAPRAASLALRVLPR